MVFKIISVGSIPAILDITFFKNNNINKKKIKKLSFFRLKKKNLKNYQLKLKKISLSIKIYNKYLSNIKNKNKVVHYYHPILKTIIQPKFFSNENNFLNISLLLFNSFNTNNSFYKFSFPSNKILTSSFSFLRLNFIFFNITQYQYKCINIKTPQLIKNQFTSQSTNVNILVSNFINIYLFQKYLMYFMNSINKKKLLGIYLVSKKYFLMNNIYFPSLNNITVFNTTIFYTINNNNNFDDNNKKYFFNFKDFNKNILLQKNWVKQSLKLKLKFLNKKQNYLNLFYKYFSRKITFLLNIRRKKKVIYLFYKFFLKKYFKKKSNA